MFDDLTLEQLTELRQTLRDGLVKLVAGEKIAEVRYGEMGRNFHPASAADCRNLIAEVQRAIDKLEGRCGGPIFFPGT